MEWEGPIFKEAVRCPCPMLPSPTYLFKTGSECQILCRTSLLSVSPCSLLFFFRIMAKLCTLVIDASPQPRAFDSRPSSGIGNRHIVETVAHEDHPDPLKHLCS